MEAICKLIHILIALFTLKNPTLFFVLRCNKTFYFEMDHKIVYCQVNLSLLNKHHSVMSMEVLKQTMSSISHFKILLSPLILRRQIFSFSNWTIVRFTD